MRSAFSSSRRTGVGQRIGTALIRHAARQAAEDGRSLLISNTRVGGPGEAFALAVGGHATLREARRLLSLDEGLSARLAGLRARAQAHAAGYRAAHLDRHHPAGVH